MIYIYSKIIVFADIVDAMKSALLKNNINVEVICVLPKATTDDDLYILFGMNEILDINNITLPKIYVVYQLEQTSVKNWLTDTYISILKNALEVWDYSIVNYNELRKCNILKIRYVPITYIPVTYVPYTELSEVPIIRDIDLLFIGSLNERRISILNRLKTVGNVVIETSAWGTKRDELLKRSRYVINIHYYENAILETVRLSYVLSHGCQVISEHSIDKFLDKDYNNIIHWVSYDNMISECEYILHKNVQKPVDEYTNNLYYNYIPYALLQSNNLQSQSLPKSNANAGDVGDEVDLFQADAHNVNGSYVLNLQIDGKSPDYNNLPFISVVTITYNRKKIFPVAVRNWNMFTYPKDKLEWIIVDDSDDDTSISNLLPKQLNIKYYRLSTSGRLSIGQKRNYGVEKASYDYIAFMDDDDYYYPYSLYARVVLLLKYPTYDLVGVTDLDIYDIVNAFSARVKGNKIAEASMMFKKSYWKQRHFIEKATLHGEGYEFTLGRRNKIINMPSCFNMIAITHNTNYTQNNRSYVKFANIQKKDNILSILDEDSKNFLYRIFKK